MRESELLQISTAEAGVVFTKTNPIRAAIPHNEANSSAERLAAEWRYCLLVELFAFMFRDDGHRTGRFTKRTQIEFRKTHPTQENEATGSERHKDRIARTHRDNLRAF